MNIASLQELKKELQHLPPEKIAELCIALAKYKKDNKEYLGYLLFQSANRRDFIKQIKFLTDHHYEELKAQKNLYYIKKSLRKLLRILNKYSRYMGKKEDTAEILIYFCQKLKKSGIQIHKSQALEKLLEGQVKKINSAIGFLHEDLQADFRREMDEIGN